MIEENVLCSFIGTTNYYKHWLGKMLYTDGVCYLVEHGAAWLVDAIASHQVNCPQTFQVWELIVRDSKGMLTMKEDTGKPELVHQDLEYTDFPLDAITLYLIDGVLLLTSEY